MKHLLLAPSIDIVKKIGDILKEEPGHLRDAIIVFPGKRPTHFLRKYLAQEIGVPYISPRMFSMDEFIDFAYASLGHDLPLIATIDSIPILFALNNAEALVNSQGAPIMLDDFMPWGFKLHSDFEELYIEQIVPDRLKEIEIVAEEKMPPRIQKQMVTLSKLYARFYEHLGIAGFSSRSSRYRTVAEDIDTLNISPYKMLIFAGFFALTASERIMLRGLLKHNKILVVLQKGPNIERTIRSLNIDVEEQGDMSCPHVEYYKTMDVHGEVIQLSALLQDADDIDERSVVVLPQADSLFPVIQQALGFVSSPYNISMGYPLFRTPLYSLLDSIGQLLESKTDDLYYVPEYLKVVLHPYIKNIMLQRSNEPTRIIFHAIEDLLAENNQRLVSLEDSEWNKTVLEECRDRLKKTTRDVLSRENIQGHIQNIHKICIQNFERINTIGDFCNRMMELVSFLSQHSTANRHPYTGPFIKTMLEALYDLQTSALNCETFRSTSGYFRMFRNYVRTIRYPFTGTPVKGLQVLGTLETRNLSFDNVYILDANEGTLPHTKKEDTMLPHNVRSYLGLPTHEQREQISRYYFETSLGGAKQAHIFFCEGENKEKSRFVERLVWQSQKVTRTLDSRTHDVFFQVYFKHKEPESIRKSDDMIAYLENSVRYSATSLNAYLHCPLLFYYSRVLNLTTHHTVAMDIDPYDRGSIVHSILEEFFIHKVGKKLRITDKDFKIIDHIVTSQFEQVFPHSDQGTLYLFKQQVHRRMGDVLQYYSQAQFKETTILECENRTTPGIKPDYWQTLYSAPFATSQGTTVSLSGKVDRVDKRNGDIVILDYKTGSREEVPKRSYNPDAREMWHRTLFSVQLPLYIILYQGAHPEVPFTAINCGLILLGARSIKEVLLFKEKLAPSDRQALFKNYHYAISTLIEEILDPDRAFTSTQEPTRICPSCDFQVMCGRQWIPKRNY